MPYPWKSRKVRGAKNKKRAHEERVRHSHSFHSSKFIQYLRSNTPDVQARKKNVKRQMTLTSKYWHLRMKFLLKQYRPFFKERAHQYSKEYRLTFIAFKNAEKFNWSKIRKLHIWRQGKKC